MNSKCLSQIEEFLQVIPNIPHESVPNGNSEQDNKVIESVGQPRQFEFEPKDHGELGMRAVVSISQMQQR